MKRSLLRAVSSAAVVSALVFFGACGEPAAPASGPEPGPAPAAADTGPPAAGAAEDLGAIGDGAVEGGIAEVVDMDFSESPWFDGRGLPPVNERLPRNPAIWNIIPEEHMPFQVGRYTGDPLRTIRMAPVWDAIMWMGNYEHMITSPGRMGAEFMPNLLESYDISEDLMTFTFTLREGMRWSDGVPVTTDDFYFTWTYWVLDPRIHPTTGTWWRAGASPRGEIATPEIVDRYTFRMHFAEPTGGLIARMAFSNYTYWLQPSHHMRQLHIDHADEAELQALVEAAGFLFPAEWHTFYQYMRPNPWYSGRTSHVLNNNPHSVGPTPSLSAWIHYTDGDMRVFQRNPYFWQIDREGNQLPYIDYVHSHLVVDLAAASIRILAGDIDHAYEWVPLAQVPLFAENAASGNYRLLTQTLLHRTDADILINQTYNCPRWRSVAQDVRFRQAISRAIDREEIVEAVYLGFARVSDYQNPRHDMDEARALLEEMGLAPTADGFLSPDSDPFVIDLVYHAGMAQFAPTAIILNEVLRELGFNVNFRQVDSAFLTTLYQANEVQMTVHFMHGPVQPLFDDWMWGRSWRMWQRYWDTGGEAADGEPIPPHVLEFYETVFGIRRNHPRYIPAARQRLRELQAEHYFHIIPVEDVIQVTLINNDLRNVPEQGFFMAGCRGAVAWWFDR